MRAGFLLDQPVPGQPFSGVPGQVSAAHGTQHTDMSYGYVQRGGDEQFHPFDYLGFRYFQIDDPGEPLTPDDVVALARHTAMPDQAPATFSSSEATIDAEFQLGAHSAMYTAQEQYIDTPTREKGSWLFDGFNESRTAMAAFGEQNLTRKSLTEFAQSQQRYWPNGGREQDLSHRTRCPRHQRVDRGLRGVGVAVLAPHRRPRPRRIRLPTWCGTSATTCSGPSPPTPDW